MTGHDELARSWAPLVPNSRVHPLVRRSAVARSDVLLAGLLGLGVLVVHDVGYLLAHPYWVDEAWVVSSTKVRLSELTGATGPTPIGFTLLLRAAVLAGTSRFVAISK